jgi:putative ubiquitin-RnfH superfamily antitoxin RatB of RatAB toxin-antitoxin module
MAEAARIEVAVAYALADAQSVITVSIPAGATVADAIALSGIVTRHPEINLASNAVGIFGRRVSLSAQPAEGDRIEIYRRLIADPKQSRLARVRKKRGK